MGFFRRERTVVRFGPAQGDEFEEPWHPPVASRHDDLERTIPREDSSWSAVVLRRLLHHVRVGNVIEKIAVLDAWRPDDATLCIVYWPPFGRSPVGVRRVVGDLEPDPTPHVSERTRSRLDEIFERHPEARTEMFMPPADPTAFADDLINNMSEPLGVWAQHLRFDGAGLGWWGTLDDILPVRPGG